MMASLGEGLSLASASGLDASALITILDQGAMSNPMFRLKGPKIIANDHAPNFPLKHQSKVQPLFIHYMYYVFSTFSPMRSCTCFRLAPITARLIVLPSSRLTLSCLCLSMVRTWTLPCVWASRWVRR